MPKKIRVHELAKELGLTSKETLELSVGLGIGVKSASSSIEDAQADRVRRKADNDGLRRDVSPPEPEPVKKTAAKKAAAPAPKPEPAPTEAAVEVKAPEAPAAEVKPEPVEAKPAEAPAAEVKPAAELPVEPPVAESPAPPVEAPAPAPIRSTSDTVRTSRPAPAPAPRPAPERQAPAPRPPAAAGGQAPQRPMPPRPAPGAAPRPPANPNLRSASGKPIPPPPGPPRSMSGKPIPPPPGAGGRAPMRPAPGARPGGAPGRPAGAGAPGARPGGGGFAGRGGGGGYAGGGAGGGRPGGGFGGAPGGPPGGGGPGGRPGGGGRAGAFGGRGGGRPPARKKKRRRNMEELEPIQGSHYVPSNAPVPEGEVIVERGSTAQDLAPKLNRSVADVVRFLLQQGEMITATMTLSDDAIELFAAEIGAEIRLVDAGQEQEAEIEAKYFDDDDDDEATQQPRPPVITVMGHVDHGKTSLLDKIRKANVVSGEAGGITQHIGAYQVVRDGREITFIDTPGHEAFTAMRARGADVTDIVILVVAADDGVMPQTREAIAHAKAADVPIIVAINKIDRADSNPDRIKQQLSEEGLVPEDWGGDVIMVPVSAQQGVGIDELLEQVLLVADLEELTANPDGAAKGFVLEGNLDVGRGPVATVVVERGTLRVGDPVVAGAGWGKVRALIDYNGKNVKFAGPSMPVQVLGLSDVPYAGDELRATGDERTARSIGEQREFRQRTAGIAGQRTTTSHVALGSGAKLEDLFEQIQKGEAATLNLILRADVQGSLEALTESLRKLERDDVKISFVQRMVGGITQNDVQLAATASGATIVGFNVRPDRAARELADRMGVEIRTYEVIYRVIEDMQSAMLGLLAPEYEEVVTGDAEVREIFSVPKIGKIAGCYVTNGVITRNSKVRFLREGTVIWKGSITSLRRFKDDAREVQTGFECGIGLSDYQDLRPGDVIETYEDRELARTL